MISAGKHNTFDDIHNWETRKRRAFPQHDEGPVFKKKNSVNIIHSSARLKESPLKSVLIQRSPFSPIPFNTILEVLARTIRQEK